MWNTYLVSLVPYPAHVALPTPALRRTMLDCLSSAVRHNRTNWCPLYVLSGLGPMLGVRGVPRCPDAAATSIAALSWLRQDSWGPVSLTREHQDAWHSLASWTSCPLAPGLGERERELARRAQRDIRAHHHDIFWTGRRPPPANMGRTLYLAAWMQAHGMQFHAWLMQRSTTRRWAPGNGQEWRVLAQAKGYTAAIHVFRLLLGCLPGGARWRSNADRQAAPRTCFECHQPATRAWTTGTVNHAGCAWCDTCFSDWCSGDAWALLPDQQLPANLQQQATQLRAERQLPRIPPVWERSPHGACPLCSLGEAGAEHLLTWCPAAAAAWTSLCGHNGPSLLMAAMHPQEDDTRLPAFLHQLSYLHCALLGRTETTAEVATGRLLRAYACSTHGGEQDDPSEDYDHSAEADPDGIAMWGPDAPDCAACAACWTPTRLHSSTHPATTRPGPRGGGELTRRPVACAAIGAHQPLATMRAEAPVAAWMPPGRNWWPRPRRTSAQDANAAWTTLRCHECQCYHACLATTRALPINTEILVETNPSPEWADAAWPYELTFDGGARRFDDDGVAGAGAVLWAHNLHGPHPRRIATTTVAIPWNAGAQVAEAIGCRAALDLLTQIQPHHRAARVVGDNLGVVRYCGGTARLQRIQMQAHLEPSLAMVLSQGWQLSWQAVRRRLNQEADASATNGLAWAARLRSQGDRSIRIRTEWTADPAALGTLREERT